MIFAITVLALLLTSLILLQADRRWNMSSYVWRLLGYNSAAEEERSDGEKEEQPARNVSASTISHEPSAASQTPTESYLVASSRSDEGDSTPKAKPTSGGGLPPVPKFTLQAEDGAKGQSDEEEEDNDMPPPSFPALNSVQRASAMPPPKMPTLKPLPNLSDARSNGLMPPPSRPGIRTSQSAPSASGLRVPTTGPLPNRNPGGNSLATPITTAVKTPNPRQKVQLRPGHSPLDWASLKRSGKNLSGVDRLVRVTPSLLKQHNGRKGRPAWSSYQGRVYNITPYLPYHPGGEGELRRVAGKDGSKLFFEVHPWVNWENMLEGCMVGIMVSEADGGQELVSGLDEMD